MKQFLLKILSYLRSPIAVVFFILLTIIYGVGAILFAILFRSRPLEQKLIRQWSHLTIWAFNIKIHFYGKENIVPTGSIIVFNHASLFDIPILFLTFHSTVRFGAKIELFKIPIFGQAMKALGILPIARHNPEAVFRVYQVAQQRLQAGESFALAPEGTRKNINSIGPFKSGPFVFAINAQAPIQPVVLKNVTAILPKGKILPNWGRWETHVDSIVLPAQTTQKLNFADRNPLKDHTLKMMNDIFFDSKSQLNWPDLFSQALDCKPHVQISLKNKKTAAVTFNLCPIEDEPHLLFIERAHNPQDLWSGHMAFPGGKEEPGDSNSLTTALRETQEEIGLDLSHNGKKLGLLNEIQGRSRGQLQQLTIIPHVFWLKSRPSLKLDSHEVADAFWIPLKHFFDPTQITSINYQTPDGDKILPAIKYRDKIIWGLSFMILSDFLIRIKSIGCGKLISLEHASLDHWPQL